MNIWNLLFSAINALIATVIIPMLGTPDSAGIDFIGALDGAVWVVLELAWAALSTFNLVIPGACLFGVLNMLLLRSAIKTFAWIIGLLRTIPVLGRWI